MTTVTVTIDAKTTPQKDYQIEVDLPEGMGFFEFVGKIQDLVEAIRSKC